MVLLCLSHKSIPYLWPKQLKNHALKAAHTYIAHVREYPLPLPFFLSSILYAFSTSLSVLTDSSFLRMLIFDSLSSKYLWMLLEKEDNVSGRTQFGLVYKRWCKTCRAVYRTARKVWSWFLWFLQFLSGTWRKRSYRTLSFSRFVFSCFWPKMLSSERSLLSMLFVCTKRVHCPRIHPDNKTHFHRVH